jgi:hypothetical protein
VVKCEEEFKYIMSIALIVLVVMGAGSNNIRAEKPVVVATTTVIASVVEDLAGDKVVVECITLPSVCPAHYDVKPSDVEKLKYASLVLAHSFEPWIDKLVSASGTKAQVVKGICRSWGTPDDLKTCYSQVARALREYLNMSVEDRLSRSLRAVDEAASWLKGFSKENGFEGAPVVIMRWQKSFVSYLGFKVVAAYSPPEMVSAKEYSEVVSNATQTRALLVIDNLPSGVDLGMKIAKEVGAVEVALHNFPKAVPEVPNVTEMWKYNARLLAGALKAANATRSVEVLQGQVLKLSRDINSLTVYLITSVALNAILVAALVIAIARSRGARK